MIYASHSTLLHFFLFLNHCYYYCYYYFLRQTFLSPSQWVPHPAHYFENHFLERLFLQSVSWEVIRKGSLTCKKAALSEVGNAAAWPKPSTAAGMGQRKPPSCQQLCMLPLTTVIQSQPLHSASGASLKSIYPFFCFLQTVYILHFQNHTGFTEFSSLQMNPAELTGWENRRSRSQQVSAGLKPS